MWAPQPESFNIGVTFADFTYGAQFSDNLTPPFQHDPAPTEFLWSTPPIVESVSPSNNPGQQPDATVTEWDSGHGSSIHTTSPKDVGSSIEGCSPSVGSSDESRSTSEIVRIPRKRRRRGSSTASAMSHSSLALTNNLLSSSNTAYLADGLLRIYHDSFETHLSCWLTEKTCPYSKDCDVSLPGNSGPDWNRVYYRVFKLDQSPSVRGRLLSSAEDRAASRALNLAIFSYASQWAIPETKRGARYPFQVDERDGATRRSRQAPNQTTFDRSLQMTAWHQARKALQSAEDIESFRVVLAHIVFSLTQKPEHDSDETKSKGVSEQNLPLREDETEGETDMKECEDLLSKLDLTMNDDGPPLHLEQGLRLIHSLRSRMTMVGAFGGRRKKKPRCWKHLQTSGLEATDQATVDVLFWLGIMFDTLSSAMHKRPLVVSLEDSDLPAINSTSVRDGDSTSKTLIQSDPNSEDCWDDMLFRRQRKRNQRPRVRWPCTEDEAASLLCEAAPIKVLLFRKVTRIQTLLARRAQSQRIETAVHSALEVYEYWQRMYTPFLRDCTKNHEKIPERVQSWYVCLAGHWHLATLLLADLIETMDETESGFESRRRERDSLNFIARFREENCRSLSDIARCACLQENSILSQAESNLFSIGQGALLSEPWTDVLVRAFATAGAVLLDPVIVPNGSGLGQDDAFRRAEDCIKALQFLGQRSDKALSAAKMLSAELKLRQQRIYKLFPTMMSSTVACAG